MEATAATERDGKDAAGPMFDNRGFGLPGQGAATPDSERSKDHWQAWEHGYLLNRALNGWPHERIAGALERTGAAVRRKLLRLLDGDDVCPPDCVDLLKVARQRMNHPARPLEASNPSEVARIGQIVQAQFDLLSGDLQRIRLLLQFNLARRVALERLDLAEIDLCLPSDVYEAIKELAGVLSKFRTQNLAAKMLFEQQEQRSGQLKMDSEQRAAAADSSLSTIHSPLSPVPQAESDETAAAREREAD